MERHFFDEHAQAIAKRQYLQPGDGDILGMFRRVAREIARPEKPEERASWEEKFYELMSTKRFSPGGRILAGAGTAHGNLLNCFVQGATENPPESLAGIMEVAKKLALVTKVGGGNGVNLDPYRSKGNRKRREVRGVAYLSAEHRDLEDFLRGLMRPPTNPEGEKVEIALKNFTRVVYGEVSPKMRALAERYGVLVVKEPPKERILVPDDMGGIVEAAKEAAALARQGLIPHVDFSLLRPEGAPIRGSGGTSSGPVSFLLEIFDNFLEWAALGAEEAGPVATLRYVYAPVLRVVRQGGTRRGAGMATLSIDHPDLLDFLTAKDLDREKAEGDISTFNISVLVTEAFMRALEEDALWPVTPVEVPGKYYPYPLEGPYTGEIPKLPEREDGAKAIPLYGGKVPARWLWHEIAWHAWATGEPGLIFVDRINELSALKGLGPRYWIRSTNPCGEIPLTVGEPCDLGALNLAAYVKDGAFQMEEFRKDVHTAIRFLDNVLDVNIFALKDNEEAAKSLRRLGLGVMGLADALIKMGLPYASEEAREKVYEMVSAMREEAIKASEELAKERGPFPLYEAHREYFQALGVRPRRNVAVLTVAPTGTTSMLMGVSSGIEPVFSPFVWRRIGGEYKPLLHPLFVELMEAYPPAPGFAKDGRWDWEKIVEEIQKDGHGSVQNLPFVPEPIRKVFQCAHDIPPLDHVRMQGVVQRAFDAEGYAANSISKCIAKGTLIPTSQGLIPIENIAPPHPEDTFAQVEGLYTAEGYRITAHYYAGKKRGVRVRLDNGAELVGAWESHRLLTPEGWRLMRELKPGDIVLGKLVPSHGPGRLPLPEASEFPLKTNARDLPLPEKMSEDLALLLGMLAADGSTVEATGFVGIATKSPGVERAFCQIVEKLFGVKSKRTVDKRTGVKNLFLTSRRLVRFVERLIGKGAAQKRVPQQILQGSPEEKLAFLRGLTLDGYVHPNMGLVVYEGKSPRLAYEAAELARSFGLPKVYQGRKKVLAPKETYRVHSVAVSGPLQELIQPIEAHKWAQREARYKVFVPEEVLATTSVGVAHPGYKNLKSVRQRGVPVVYNTTADRLGWPTEILAHRVVEVEEVGEVEMYDIEVEEVHRYVVNGLISHNTINLPNQASVEDVEEAYAEAYRTGCKGITVYRDGSREFQVLTVKKESKETKEAKPQEARAEEAKLEEAPPRAPKAGEPIYERPGRLMGFTDMVKLLTPEGVKRSFLVTVNVLEGHPIEVILTSGKAGDEANADSEALGRVVSIALQYGVPPEAIIRTLRGINGGLYGTYQGRLVSSKADLIAVALETIPKELKGLSLTEEAGAEPLPALSGGGVELQGAGLCPSCGEKALVREEGCWKCQACGYSKCG
jgi:adenosylcobalamin-dependent ribonucleoside-diphosphate reductase